MTGVVDEPAGAPSNGETFWRFSLAYYEKPQVSAALIALQDRRGFDANMMLFALWLGLSGRPPLDAQTLAVAEAAVCTIRVEIIEPLRRLRRALKHERAADIQRLRGQLQAVELAAEKTEQFRLAASVTSRGAEAPVAARLAVAAANLSLYLGPHEAASCDADRLRRALAEFAG
ncbi:MAG: TIGR02444 family protein [Alphaproteobacteria bacterium]|nr:TIGR02444 family protein [Alphaproteobacteria bacterium]